MLGTERACERSASVGSVKPGCLGSTVIDRRYSQVEERSDEQFNRAVRDSG